MNPIENSNYTQFPNNFGENEPSEIIDWIRNIKENKLPVPNNFNWLGFAEETSLRARVENNLKWAGVAIEAYDFLMRTREYQESCFLSILNLRVYFIKRFGNIKNDAILDLDQIVQLLLKSMGQSLNEVRKIADDWIRVDIIQIRELRRIKNRLSIFKELDESMLNLYPELLDWLTILNRLP